MVLVAHVLVKWLEKENSQPLFGVLCVLPVCTEKPPAVLVNGQRCNCTAGVKPPIPFPSVWQNDDVAVSLLLNLAECECRGGSCDPRTGECTCSNGLTGKQCDVCMHNYEIPVANGPDSMRCEGVYAAVLGKEVREALAKGSADCSILWAVCDSCVLLLLEDLQSIEMSFPSIRSQLVNLSASSIAWARLHSLNSTMATVAVRGRFGAAFCLFVLACWLDFSSLLFQNQLREYHRAMNKVRQRADELEDENTDLTQDLNALQHRVGYFFIFPLPEQELPFYLN